jgi:hypothetical protein
MEAFEVDDSVSEIVIFLFGPGVLNLAGSSGRLNCLTGIDTLFLMVCILNSSMVHRYTLASVASALLLSYIVE